MQKKHLQIIAATHHMARISALFCLIVCSAFLLSGCASYQYVALNSSLPQNDKKEFVSENDTVRITYSFRGYNCPINIEVYNKLSTPIYVDWKKSSVVINEKRLSYWKDKATIQGTIDTESTRIGGFVSGSGVIDGTIEKTEHVSFIPPQSYVSVSPYFLKSAPFELTQSGKEKMESHSTRRTKYAFDQHNTPFQFRSFVTLSTSENFDMPIFNDQQFWVTEVMLTESDPGMVPKNETNHFYLKQVNDLDTGTSSVLLLVGAMVLLLIATTAAQ
jgi:hypothetical protein